MKYFAALLLFCAAAFAQQKPQQIVPPVVLSAKTIVVRTYWPNGTRADQNGVQFDGEKFIKKWGRYRVVRDISDADLAVLIVVEPMTVNPGFWQRLAWEYQAHGYCYGQSFADGSFSANCYAPAPAPLLPSTILTGSILLYDAAELRARKSMDVEPLMVSFAEKKGSSPLIGAGKKLRKEIDGAAERELLRKGANHVKR